MELFSIHCTTCNARLTVRSMRAIGQILACPKCHSMVQIAAPAGWVPPVANGKPVQSSQVAAGKTANNATVASEVVTDVGQRNAPPTSPPSLDSDFSALPADSPAAESESVEEMTAAATGKSPAEVFGRRAAIAAGLIVGLAFTLLMLLRSGETLSDEPVQPLAQVDSATANGHDPPTTPKEPSPDQPLGERSDVETPAPVANADGNESPDSPKKDLTEILKSVCTTSFVGESAVIKDPVTTPASQGDGDTPVEPSTVIADHEEAADLTSEVTAEDRAVAARLEERIAAIDFQGSKLSDLVEFLSRMANVTLRFDPEALVAAHVETTARVSVQQTDTTAARVLDAALAKLGLTYEIRDGQAVIVTRPDPSARPQPPKGDKPAADDAEPAAGDSADPAADLRLNAVTP